jgi:hypothetical protein
LYTRSIRGIGASINRFSVSAGSDESEVFEGNQLLRIEARQISLNLDVAIVAITGLKGTDPRILVGDIALSDPRQFHAPVDNYDRIVLSTAQQLVDLSLHNGGGSSLKRYAVQVWISLHDRSFDCR